MNTSILIRATRFVAWLPKPGRIMLAYLLATLAWLMPNRRRRVAQDNIRLCLPELIKSAQARLLRQHLLARAHQLLQIGPLWHWPLNKTLAQITEVKGWQTLLEAHSSGKGVIVAVPHIGNWELTGLCLSQQLENTAILYRASSSPEIDAFLEHQRSQAGAETVAASVGAIRKLLAILKQGGYVGILPDQRPRQGEGRMVDFFGQPALTMTLLSRLQQRTGAKVVFAVCLRSAAEQYQLKIIPATPGIYDQSFEQALRAMNQQIEACSRLDLPQYQWSYRRFPAPQNAD